MAEIPSIGDILMQSQLAWRIGRSFTAGGDKGAAPPPEFVEVETEVNGLADALKLLAETLLLADSGGTIARAGVAAILLSCQQTLKDLESLVERCQVTKKHRTSGGFSIERSWREPVLADFRKMAWMTDGGDIRALRDMLRLHTSTIALTMQALQSKSPTRVEEAVAPIAEEIDGIHGTVVAGDLGETVEEARIIVAAVAGHSPALPPRRNQPAWDSPLLEGMPEALRFGRARSSSLPQLSPEIPPLDAHHRRRHHSRRESDTSTAPSSSETSEKRSVGASSWQQTAPASPGSTRQASNVRRRIDDAADLPTVRDADEAGEQPQQRTDSSTSASSPILPPPAIPPDPDPGDAKDMRKLSLGSASGTEKMPLGRSMTTASQREAFEKAAFGDSAIPCELRGKAVEYVQLPKDGTQPLDVEMGKAMDECRIYVVRKQNSQPGGSTRVATSIWALSDDRAVWMQQKPATLFQNELMGQTLCGTYKTAKTLRIHDGLSGILAYQEQMCGMENLRLWYDDDTRGVLAMIHFSAIFKPGYLTFYLNSSSSPVRVKDEGGKEVKIKGLRIPAEKGPGGRCSEADQHGRKAEGKRWITGAKVEFATEIEKVLFLEKVREVQQKMISLPGF